MFETISEMYSSGQLWEIIIKVLLTAAASGVVALCGTLISNIIAKNKESKIYKYASTLVEAAEQKFPNEGTKMGPQKMDYVMSQIVIRFPSVKDNRYLYNIVEAAVYKLNDEKQKEKAIKEFEEKYGEGSFVQVENDNKVSDVASKAIDVVESAIEEVNSQESTNASSKIKKLFFGNKQRSVVVKSTITNDSTTKKEDIASSSSVSTSSSNSEKGGLKSF